MRVEVRDGKANGWLLGTIQDDSSGRLCVRLDGKPDLLYPRCDDWRKAPKVTPASLRRIIYHCFSALFVFMQFTLPYSPPPSTHKDIVTEHLRGWLAHSESAFAIACNREVQRAKLVVALACQTKFQQWQAQKLLQWMKACLRVAIWCQRRYRKRQAKRFLDWSHWMKACLVVARLCQIGYRRSKTLQLVKVDHRGYLA